jgi:hypothetical protein
LQVKFERYVGDGFTKGQAILVELRLRNRSGLDVQVPTEIEKRSVPGEVALRQGLSFKLSVANIDPAQVLFSKWSNLFPALGWNELAPARFKRFQDGGASRNLGPGESFTAARIDLRDWFDLSRPGLYRIHLELTKESGLGAGECPRLIFVIIGEGM